MRTTLDLPDPLFKEVKTRAVQQGVKLKDLIACYIEAGLRGQIATARSASGNRSPLPVAIPRQPGAVPHPAMTNAELQALLDEEDLAGYRHIAERNTPNP